MSELGLNEILKSLEGPKAEETTKVASAASLTDPVYVEKLASAVEFLAEKVEADPAETEEAASEEKVASAGDIKSVLKAKLQGKLESLKQEETREVEKVASGVLETLKQFTRTPVQPEEVDDEDAVKQAEAAADLEEETEAAEDESQVSVDPAASTLLEMLGEADTESADDGAKTAEAREGEKPMSKDETLSLLKQKMSARQGKEA